FSAQPIPSAGPYYIASLGDHRTVLQRNPNYHGDRPRRSARVVYTNDIPTPEAVSLANEGAVDFLPQDFDNTTPLLNPYDVLYRCGGDERQQTLAGIIRSDLARIGIRVRVDQAAQCPETYDARARRADLLLFSALGSQELDPQPFLEQALATDGHYGSALGHG